MKSIDQRIEDFIERFVPREKTKAKQELGQILADRVEIIYRTSDFLT